MSLLKDKRSCRTEAAAGPADIRLGRFVGLAENGAPLVDFTGNPAGLPVAALATARYELAPLGAAVALMFIDGDPARPLAIGLVAQAEPVAPGEPPPAPEETLTLAASRDLVLQCGRASIVLTRAGKVLIRGTYVSTRSSGMHRITGASVHIN